MTLAAEVIRFGPTSQPSAVSLDQYDGNAGEDFLWVDFVQAEGWVEAVKKHLGLVVHAAHVQDSLNLAHPPFFDRTDDYVMIIINGLVALDGGISLTTRPTTLFVTDRYVVTVRPQDSVSAPELRARLLGRWKNIPKDPTRMAICYALSLNDRFLALKPQQTAQVETWQRELLDPANPFSDWMLLVSHRSNHRKIETMLEGQYDAVMRWRDDSDTDSDSSLSVRFNDLLEHIGRALSQGRQIQAELDAIVQMNFSAVSHRTNEVMRTLTVVTAIFMPLTLVAGIFGMNFEFMPELRWRYSYFVALGAMVSLAAILYFSFRRRNWF